MDPLDKMAQRLLLVKQWEMERDQRLKEYQENLRSVVSAGHETIAQSHKNYAEWGPSQNFQTSESDFTQSKHKIKYNPESILLKETPQTITENPSNDKREELREDMNVQGTQGTRPFLRRGQGLARFRINNVDYNRPPDIYKNIKIRPIVKQYVPVVTSRPNSARQSNISKPGPKKIKNKPVPVNKKLSNTSDNLPVKLFYKEPVKQPEKVIKKFPKAQIKELVLKSPNVATEWYSVFKEKEIKNGKFEQNIKQCQVFDRNKGNDEQNVYSVCQINVNTCDQLDNRFPSELNVNKNGRNDLILENKAESPTSLEKKKQEKLDKKELKMFEILEEKIVNDSSFCSDLSVFKNMIDETMRSTPSRDSVCRKLKFVNDNNVKKADEVENGYLDRLSDFDEQDDEDMVSDKENNHDEISSDDEVNKTKETLDDQSNLVKLSEKEMAVKIQRKALKDNVKNLLNWEASVKKRALMKKKTKLKKVKKKKETTVEDVQLKKKYDELENEIKIFKKEKNVLNKLRQKHHEDVAKFEKERKEIEKRNKEEYEEIHGKLDEERKRLQRDKLIFDKYCKEMKNQPRREEREEINNLNKEIESLKSSITEERARWSSAQARLRTQIKTLTIENQNLKQELEQVKKQTIKKVTFKNSNSMYKTISEKVDSLMPSARNKSFNKVKSLSARVDSNLHKKNLRRTKSVSSIGIQSCDDAVPVDNVGAGDVEKVQSVDVHEVVGEVKNDFQSVINTNGEVNKDLLQLDLSDLHSYYTSSSATTTTSKISEIKKRLDELDLSDQAGNTSSSPKTDNVTQVPQQVKPTGQSNCWKEIRLSDGNYKKISPDGDIVKVYYFNGDVKEENRKDNIVKYFYNSDRTWCTTYPDKTQFLEFANGQTERRLADGSTDVTYPNGTKRHKDKDGNEEWRFSDGTIKRIKINGDHVLVMPNGQREIRTKEYMKRQYPDGTVKLVYPDRTEETRYFNGRVRVKDRNGHLLMDSGGM